MSQFIVLQYFLCKLFSVNCILLLCSHIREHLDGVVELKQEEPLSASEKQFQYFKVHDYDNNNMLDGIELVSALTHYHAEESSEQKPGMTDDELSSLLDTILEEDDENGDGYIDYAEFMLSQR